jgi:phosphodiesterase/alkaline phosphatase D-like protein
VRKTTRRELLVATTATAMTAAVPPAYGRLLSRHAGIGRGTFRDGVASGEPSPTAITFWSRIHTDTPRSGARLIVARDAGLDDVVAVARVPTGRSVGYTLKTRIGGLDPYTEYYYAWQSSNDVSEIGRTRTTPPRGSGQPVRIAFSSCQHYNYGYFTPHASAAAEPLDLYVFLGDYIYEAGRVPDAHVREDRIDAVDLRTYRKKYRVYRQDAALRELHRLTPIVHVWDDHEVENNYTDNNPAPSPAQRAAGYRAAFEWLPKMAAHTDRFKIYKKLSLGGMVDVFLLDGRQYRTGYDDGLPRHMLGEPQMQWLIDGLKASKAVWKIVANQVVISADPFGTGGSSDQWDGHPADRERLLGEIERAGLRNVVFITGDAHVFMCNLLASDFERLAANPNQVPAAVEYVGGSVTSPGLDRPESEVRAYAPWNRQYDGRDHGYALMALDAQNLVTEFRRSDLSQPAGGTVAFERFTQPSGLNNVTRETLQPPTGV